MTLVFVYGTLKRGYVNHFRCLANAKFIGKAVSSGSDYIMQEMGFPVLWDGAEEGGGKVAGEIFEIDNGELERCDRLEGHPTMYERQQREFIVSARGVGKVIAWVYLWRHDQDHDEIEPVDGVYVWDRQGQRKRA